MIENRKSTNLGATGHVRSASWLLALSLPVMGCSAAQAPRAAGQPATPAAVPATANAATTAATTAGNMSSTAARQEFVVERSLGADCPVPGKDNRDYGPINTLLYGMCEGRMPAHVADMLAQLSPEQLQLSKDEYQQLLADEVGLRAVPGLGQRADFWVSVSNGWIRSFEGPAPDTTVYLMLNKSGLRAYRAQGQAAPRDVTAEILPPEPVLSAAERAFYYGESRGPSDPFLLTDKLYYAPTMRWVMEFDSHDTLPSNTPHRLNGNMVHLGFVTWTGTRFELRPTVSRSQWPCYPVAKGEDPCYRDEAAPDPYVTSDK